VHGCFWHQHSNCRRARQPQSNKDYWRPKLEGNRRRDMVCQRKLRKLGWKILIVWECQTFSVCALQGRISDFLNEGSTFERSQPGRRASVRRS
jgi:DNA mismatch endonuclease (patch repair protein)